MRASSCLRRGNSSPRPPMKGRWRTAGADADRPRADAQGRTSMRPRERVQRRRRARSSRRTARASVSMVRRGHRQSTPPIIVAESFWAIALSFSLARCVLRTAPASSFFVGEQRLITLCDWFSEILVFLQNKHQMSVERKVFSRKDGMKKETKLEFRIEKQAWSAKLTALNVGYP